MDTALQVTDRPEGKARRLRQVLLCQLRLAPKPPQQPGKGGGPCSCSVKAQAPRESADCASPPPLKQSTLRQR